MGKDLDRSFLGLAYRTLIGGTMSKFSKNDAVISIRKIIDQQADEEKLSISDQSLTAHGSVDSFVYRPPVSITKFLFADRDEIKRILGVNWDETIVFSLSENLSPLLSRLEEVEDALMIRTFSVSGNRWKERTGSIFKIPGEDVVFFNTDFGFVARKRDWPKIRALISQIQLSPSLYNEKSLDRVFWDAKTESLKKDILFFSKSKEWFDKRDLPYSRSYLLYGPPGNGKTSAIRAISKFFHSSPSQFSFTGRYEDPDSAFLSWVGGGDHEEDMYDDHPRALRPSRIFDTDDEEESNPRIRVLLLEDIDRFFSKEEGFKTPVSFSAILNALDGVAQRKNSILIATANNPEKIDSQVLFRPGRFDLRIPFEAPSRDGIRSFMRKLSEEDSISDSMVDRVADAAKGHSLAFVKGIYLAAANKAFARSSQIISDEDIELSLSEFLSNLGKDIKSTRSGTGF